MNRFEIEYSPQLFMIITFKRLNIAEAFLYEGEIYISRTRTTKIEDAFFQFNFQFTREKANWENLGEFQVEPLTDTYAGLLPVISNIIQNGIKGFENSEN